MRQVFLRVGDVVLISRKEHLVDLVNDCRARCFSSEGSVSISNVIDSEYVLRHLSQEELNVALSTRRLGGQSETKTNEAKGNESMSKENKKPIAGRAAAVHALKAKGVNKKEAMEKIQAKFDCSEKAFNVIWDAKPRGAKPAKNAKAAKGGKKAPASKKAPTAPPAPKSTPPPPPAAAPAAATTEPAAA